MRGTPLFFKLVLLVLCLAGCSNTADEDQLLDEEALVAFEIVNKFVYHFTDSSITKVVWVSDFVTKILTDEDMAAAKKYTHSF